MQKVGENGKEYARGDRAVRLSGRQNPRDVLYPESRFGGFTDIDGTIAFYFRVNALIEPSTVVLDVGCGRGKYAEDPVAIRRDLRVLKGKAGRVIGIDVAGAGYDHPFIDDFHLIEEDRWPVDDDSVDLCLCDNVVEHLEAPEEFFAEVRRVLRVGGHLCIRTPNSWSYVALASRLIPNSRHARVLRKVQEGRAPGDVFPTYYRCNSIPRLRSVLAGFGFEAVVYGYESEPSYLTFSRTAYRLGVLYQKLAPGFMKSTIFAFARLGEPPDHR